jgi:hypothetical protein
MPISNNRPAFAVLAAFSAASGIVYINNPPRKIQRIGNRGDAHYHIMKGPANMFLKNPFVPSGRVTHVIVDKNAPDEFILNLKKLKITPIPTKPLQKIPAPVSTHPDMQIFHAGSGKVICEPNLHEYYVSRLAPLGIEVIAGKTHLCSNYPYDIAYNIARVSNYALHKTSHTDGNILRLLSEEGIRIINVAQGYTKCAVCIVGENAVVTSDLGIAKALKGLDVEVLVIEKGDIKLEGMEYGFIGGTCGLIGPRLLAFCGNIEKHRDYKQIKAFAKRHNTDLISLCSGKLIDIGSIIPIKQEVIYWNNYQ